MDAPFVGTDHKCWHLIIISEYLRVSWNRGHIKHPADQIRLKPWPVGFWLTGTIASVVLVTLTCLQIDHRVCHHFSWKGLKVPLCVNRGYKCWWCYPDFGFGLWCQPANICGCPAFNWGQKLPALSRDLQLQVSVREEPLSLLATYPWAARTKKQMQKKARWSSHNSVQQPPGCPGRLWQKWPEPAS